MERVYTRQRAEQELVCALTRQNGYTSGAFGISRMAGIVEHFRQANAFRFELAKSLTRMSSESGRESEGTRVRSPKALEDKYANDVLSFTAEMGIIERVPSPGPAHLSKFMLSAMGVGIRAARASDCKEEMEKLVLEHAILEHDADAYLTVLCLLRGDSSFTSEQFSDHFLEEIQLQRKCRADWMAKAFPVKAILTRLVRDGGRQVRWFKVERNRFGSVDLPKKDFGRHHALPRKSWAVELQHYDPDAKQLTEAGERMLQVSCWPGIGGRGWIAPSQECMKFLRVSAEECLYGANAPTFELLREQGIPIGAQEDVVQKSADFLERVFDSIRLFHARQAPTSVLRYYLIILERELKRRFDHDEVLRAVARDFPNRFSFYSSRTGALAYYQVRGLNA